ncbi:hypothetical protein MsAg5_05820 [Methanosarcinaceae archaeon Ag5]|uniref:Uncharacterized protein n=1 Tax=Methanolapillus africanus TaxID=3028297 RepID=A0AAE4MHJ4_9EURY|nr:hypothetical protein [Methanosarcinaceae archaeon Ag5]
MNIQLENIFANIIIIFLGMTGGIALAEILKTPLKKCKECGNRSYLGEQNCMFCGGPFK